MSFTIACGRCFICERGMWSLDLVRQGKIEPAFVVTHRLSLDDGPKAYKIFRDKEDNCINWW